MLTIKMLGGINMALVTTKEMFEKSMKEGFAIGAFNINNMEIIQGIVDAAAETNSPVILQTSASAIKYAATLNAVLETLRLSDAKRVYTDRLRNYRSLIETKIHRTLLYGTNHIERHNLTIRTHLKRLARKTICFSRSAVILSAILKIYGDKSIDVIYIIYTYCPIRTKCLLSSERRCSSNRIKG